MTVNTKQETEQPEKKNHDEEDERGSGREKQSTTIMDSPPSTFSLSPQSNRSYKTPSPAGDFGAHDFSWAEPTPSPLAQPNRSFPAEPLVLTTSLDPEARDGVVLDHLELHDEDDDDDDDDGERTEKDYADDGSGRKAGLGSFNRRQLRPDLPNLKKTATTTKMRKSSNGVAKRVLLGFRVCGLAFCLISFSVMAANRDQGWALDSFYRYKEFRYCLGVNVLGFVYSGFQVFDLIHFITTEKHIVQHWFRCYFNFFMDQALAYLLMSASSSASTRVDDWRSNWGKDKFPDMAHASVGLSFAAFVAFAWSSIISGYILCTPKAL